MDKKVCTNFSTSLGCGKCKISLDDPKNIALVKPRYFEDLVSEVLYLYKERPYTRLDMRYSTVDCRGNIEFIIYDTMSHQDIDKSFSSMIINWSKGNADYISTLSSSIYILGVLTTLSTVDSIKNKEHKADILGHIIKYTDRLLYEVLSF